MTRKLGSSMRALLLVLATGLAASACGDDPTGIMEEHGDADGLRLVMGGETLATYSFETGTWTGELEVDEGEETGHIDVLFLDEDGDVIDFGSDFYLEVEIEDADVASFEQHSPGDFAGHLHGEAAGETEVVFKLMHGAVGTGHADLVTAGLHAHVT